MASLDVLIDTVSLTPEERSARIRQIYDAVLRTSPYLTTGNFTRIHPNDLALLFDQYDERFFAGQCRAALGDRTLTFRLSKRMTSAGGKTFQYTPRNGGPAFYEIAISSTLLFRTFAGDDHRPITVVGLACRDRLEALQRVFEHEMIHLAEMLRWAKSSCAAEQFQGIAHRFFGHTDHRHQLITPREVASVKFGIQPGGWVRFHLEGKVYEGIVNRITRRATVLVPSEKGVPYSNGGRYLKFYVPVQMLEAIEDPTTSSEEMNEGPSDGEETSTLQR